MDGRDRSVLDRHGQGPAVFVGQDRRRAPAPAVDQARRPVRVQLGHPVAHDLHNDTADHRGPGAGRAVIDRSEREKPANSSIVVAQLSGH